MGCTVESQVDDVDMGQRVNTVREALEVQRAHGVSHLQSLEMTPERAGKPSRSSVRRLRRRRNNALHCGFGAGVNPACTESSSVASRDGLDVWLAEVPDFPSFSDKTCEVSANLSSVDSKGMAPMMSCQPNTNFSIVAGGSVGNKMVVCINKQSPDNADNVLVDEEDLDGDDGWDSGCELYLNGMDTAGL